MPRKKQQNLKCDKGLEDALESAAKAGDNECVNKLCAEICQLKLSRDTYDTALYAASKIGHSNIVRTLISSGADVNCYNRTRFRRTPLIMASEAGHTETARILIRAGADSTIERKGGDDALSVAASSGHLDTVNALIQEGVDMNYARHDALSRASGKGHIEIVKLLLTRGAKNFSDALYSAMANDHSQIVELLLHSGAKINEPFMRTNELPLIYVALLGHIKTAETLLIYGAEVDLVLDDRSTSALMVAVGYSKLEMTRLLLKWNANVNLCIQNPLLGTFGFSEPPPDLRIMRLLLLYGADIRQPYLGATFSTCSTPLLISMRRLESNDNQEILREYLLLLISAGGLHVTRRYHTKNVNNFFITRIRPILQNLSKEFTNIFPTKALLFDSCRRLIRRYLLSQKGGNQMNLIQGVSKLPLPKKLKRSLLFDIDISWIDDKKGD